MRREDAARFIRSSRTGIRTGNPCTLKVLRRSGFSQTIYGNLGSNDLDFLTLPPLLGKLVMFREYPECAVIKRFRGRLWSALHWIQEIHHRIRPDWMGESVSLWLASAYLSRLRHPPPRCTTAGPHGEGLCGPEQRNGVEQLGRLERAGTTHLGHRRLLSRLSGLWYMQSEVRPRAGFRTSPKRV
jgi:hypothetical protein